MSSPDHIIFVDSILEFKVRLTGSTRRAEKIFVLADVNTARHCLPILKQAYPELEESDLIVLDPGDDEKNISSLHHIWSTLLFRGANRYSMLINLGGGMITDIGGFAASTFQRGIEFINIPTSLLGMVDASIGGKTGINIDKVKNQAGTFARASGIIIYPDFLETLPENELKSGFAEVIKTAVTFDSELFESLSLIPMITTDHIKTELIKKTAEIKKVVTANDYKDLGERQCLNFGHSIGHALESLFQIRGEILPHGIAVAAGMICESFISHRQSNLPEGDLSRINACIRMHFPRVEFNNDDIEDIIGLIRHDKKNLGGEIVMPLLSEIGKCDRGIACREDVIRESLEFYINKSEV